MSKYAVENVVRYYREILHVSIFNTKKEAMKHALCDCRKTLEYMLSIDKHYVIPMILPHVRQHLADEKRVWIGDGNSGEYYQIREKTSLTIMTFAINSRDSSAVDIMTRYARKV